jgi:hypothetical protein
MVVAVVVVARAAMVVMAVMSQSGLAVLLLSATLFKTLMLKVAQVARVDWADLADGPALVPMVQEVVVAVRVKTAAVLTWGQPPHRAVISWPGANRVMVALAVPQATAAMAATAVMVATAATVALEEVVAQSLSLLVATSMRLLSMPWRGSLSGRQYILT